MGALAVAAPAGAAEPAPTVTLGQASCNSPDEVTLPLILGGPPGVDPGTFRIALRSGNPALVVPTRTPTVDRVSTLNVFNLLLPTVAGQRGVADVTIAVAHGAAETRLPVTVRKGYATMTGTDRADVLLGGPGPQTLRGRGGPDTLCGGDGDDVLDGGDGDDTIDGGRGLDRADGGTGDDAVHGGTGPDTLDGGPGADRVTGDTGGDHLSGGEGDDYLNAHTGDDRLDGGPGADSVDGGDGNDRLDGGPGDDWVYGGRGDDVDTGGPGGDDFVTTYNDILTDYRPAEGDTRHRVAG
ncbi:calcium-binding protein [Pilimelia terevasa]|uniref:calcium-binding protein n=1 Tax=Pilimelia terevasa TaxID=53372 RepID=UPI001668B16E|nr:calcium-binding protein [Pilimelia terevasa]